MRRSLVSALLLAFASPDAGAYLMVDGNAVAALDSWGFSGNSFDGNVISFDSGTTDQLYEMYGYLGNATSVVRVNPTHFSELTAINGAGGTASSQLMLNATGAAALGLSTGDITLDYSFVLDGATRSLVWDVDVTSASASTLDLVFYAYADFDLEGSAGNDLATGGPAGFQVTDGGTGLDVTFSSSTVADRFEIGPWPVLQSTLDAMEGVGAADLANTGSPFGPSDFTGALQFDFSLAPGGSQGFGMTLIPEPTTAFQLALGLLGLAIAGRRRA